MKNNDLDMSNMSETDMIKYIIEQINNINFDDTSSFFVDYVFITGNKYVADEINKYIDELRSDRLIISNRPTVRYDKNCPPDVAYWFREGLLPFVEKAYIPHNIYENIEE